MQSYQSIEFHKFVWAGVVVAGMVFAKFCERDCEIVNENFSMVLPEKFTAKCFRWKYIFPAEIIITGKYENGIPEVFCYGNFLRKPWILEGKV